MIVADLAALAVPVGDLDLYPGNPRQGDVDAIARSLEAFGQRKPIVATPEGTVVAGNHTLLAARQLGWTEIAVVRVNDSGTMAEAYALADNRTAELGHYDPVALAEMIQSVQDADDSLMAAISYDAADLDDLLAAMQEAAPVVIEHTTPDRPYGGDAFEEGSFTAPAKRDLLAAYQTKGIRSVVLDYPLDEYEHVAELAAKVRADWGIATTAELFKELLERATQ